MDANQKPYLVAAVLWPLAVLVVALGLPLLVFPMLDIFSAISECERDEEALLPRAR